MASFPVWGSDICPRKLGLFQFEALSLPEGQKHSPRCTQDIPHILGMQRVAAARRRGWTVGGASGLWRMRDLAQGGQTLEGNHTSSSRLSTTTGVGPALSRGRGDGQVAVQRARVLQGRASLCRRGKPGIPLPRGQPLSRRAPTAPVASLGLSHSLNTVSHCCPPWQSQICPGAPGEPCSLSLVSLYGRGDGPWQRGEREPHCSSAKLGRLDTS